MTLHTKFILTFTLHSNGLDAIPFLLLLWIFHKMWFFLFKCQEKPVPFWSSLWIINWMYLECCATTLGAYKKKEPRLFNQSRCTIVIFFLLSLICNLNWKRINKTDAKTHSFSSLSSCASYTAQIVKVIKSSHATFLSMHFVVWFSSINHFFQWHRNFSQNQVILSRWLWDWLPCYTRFYRLRYLPHRIFIQIIFEIIEKFNNPRVLLEWICTTANG